MNIVGQMEVHHLKYQVYVEVNTQLQLLMLMVV